MTDIRCIGIGVIFVLLDLISLTKQMTLFEPICKVSHLEVGIVNTTDHMHSCFHVLDFKDER